MAYTGTVTITTGLGPDGRNMYRVSIAEAEGAAASEATITGLPTFGRVWRQLLTKASGTATTFDPILTTSANGSGNDVVVENDTAAGSPIDNTAADGATYYSSTGTLYHKSVPDAGTDNTVTVVYHITEGW